MEKKAVNVDFQGARFYKADLHIHTPASKCWRGSRDSEEMRRIFKKLRDEGIEVVGVTDHNTVKNIDEARRLGKEYAVRVIPAVEVSTKEGHVVALFDERKPTKEIENWLATMGFVGEKLGDLETVATEPNGTRISITDMFSLIEDNGGIAIAPHPNSKDGGFLGIMKKQKGRARQDAYNSPHLRGLEVGSERKSVLELAAGRVHGFGKKYGCIETSDAHELDEIGSGFTYVKLGDFGIGAFKQVFYDPAMRIRFADEWPLKQHAWIEKLEVSQGFFDRVSFRFHPDMSCLVGGKGVGKSLLIELIRFSLDLQSPVAGIGESSKEMIRARTCLGEGGTVTLHVVSENGERYRIQRTVSDLDEGPEIYYADTETKASDRVSNIFQCQIYSQNEVIDLGKNLPALLDWLDSFIDLSDEMLEIESLKEKVLRLLRDLDEKHALAVQVPELEKKKKELEEKRKLLNKKVKEPILKLFPSWQQEERYLKRIQEGLKKLKDEIVTPLQKVRMENYLPEPEGDTPNRKEILEQRESLLKLGENFGNAGKDLLKAIIEKVKPYKNFTLEWREKFEEAQIKHAEVVKSAGVKNASAITSELNKVTQVIEGVEADLKEARAGARGKTALEGTLRGTLMPAYFDCFSRIFKKRLDKAEGICTALSGFVRINVLQMHDRSNFETVIQRTAKGSRIRAEKLQKLVSRMTPIELMGLIADRNGAELSKKTGVNAEIASGLIEHMWAQTIDEGGFEKPSEIYKIMLIELRDRVTVELRVDTNVYKPMNELSGGSKCTAILSVALVEGRCPLIVDQPEDALDNPFVFEQIVKTVRETKTGRQYIFATHNPNVAVASDADLIYCLKATAEHGDVDKHGSIDEISTRDKVVANLEGGERAFALRSQKYDMIVRDPSGVVLDIRLIDSSLCSE